MKPRPSENKMALDLCKKFMQERPEEWDSIMSVLGYFRPKPSVKWPKKKNKVQRGELGGNSKYGIDKYHCEWCGTTEGNLHQSDCRRLVEDLKRLGYNQAIDDYQAAVEAAGVEYGLDEGKIGDLLVALGNDAEFVSSTTLRKYAHALKLSERELIVKKEK